MYPNSLKNTCGPHGIEGFSLCLRTPGGRGLYLSLIGGFFLTVDGVSYKESQLRFSIGGEPVLVGKLKEATDTFWDGGRIGVLYAEHPGGLSAGAHRVELGISLLTGWFKAKEEYLTAPPKPEKLEVACCFVLPKGPSIRYGVSDSCFGLQLKGWGGRFEPFFREAAALGAAAVDFSAAALIEGYPRPTEAFLNSWRETAEACGIEPAVMDSFMDRLRYREKSMDEAEALSWLRQDIRLAKALQCRSLRLMHDLPLDLIKKALPYAEEADVVLLDEVLAPATIRQEGGRKGDVCARELELIEKTRTKHFGFLVNGNIFQEEPNPRELLIPLSKSWGKKQAALLTGEILKRFKEGPWEACDGFITDNCRELQENRELYLRKFGIRLFGNRAKTEDLKIIAPYIGGVYARCIHMGKGEAGEYGEPAVPTKKLLDVLASSGYDGYVYSMRMGAFANSESEEKRELKRHGAMLLRMLDEY